MKKHFELVGLSTLLLLLVASNSLFAWTAPTQSPPNGNVAAPVNVGATSQIKAGGLGVGALDVAGGAIVRGTTLTTDLDLTVTGRVGANAYCDINGANCIIPPGGSSGGITSLTGGAGITLSPTTITTTGSVAINPAYTQRRVTGTCPVGQAIRVINQDGTVTCQPAAATCMWKDQAFSQGASCRTGTLSCLSGTAGYTYQTCSSNGTWLTGGTGCTNGSGSMTSCP